MQHKRAVHEHGESAGGGGRSPRRRWKKGPTPKEELGAPIPNADGKWVDRNSFTGRKSFGYFECPPCGGKWWYIVRF